MATAADTPVATDLVTGPARSPRDIVPAGLWEKQVGLLMRDYPYDREVATLAGVSTGTVSNVLNRPDTVRQATRERVEKAIAEAGFVRQASPAREADERLGHEDGSVSARYSHVTDSMRALLMEQLTEVWHESLDDRLALAQLPGPGPRPAVAGARRRALTPHFKITPS